MFGLAHESFAKHGGSFFLEKNGGVLIVSEAVLNNGHEDIQKKRQEVLEVVKQKRFDDIRKKELERHEALETKRDLSGVMCMACEDESVDGVFLFPLCEEAHHYACLECLGSVVENNNYRLVCPECRGKGDNTGLDEYRKMVGGNEEVSALVAQLQAPDNFSLTHDLPNEAVLLTEKTTVTMSNIEISMKLFFVLLEKTRVTVNENFSITEHYRNEDCIGEHGMARETPICLVRRYESVSPLALENIERMAPKSIGCSLKKLDLSDTGLINILPKLRINEDSEVEEFKLAASKEEYITEILEQEKTICVG
ncbi:MAG: uncharacterized protein A8A55_3186, partial [Amphiamblys sp. WSBS2006]